MTNSKSASASLLLRLIIGLVAVSVLAMIATGTGLYFRFKETSSRFREQTLSTQVLLITKYLENTADPLITLPFHLKNTFKSGGGKYAIVAEGGILLGASDGVTVPIAAINPTESRTHFILRSDDEAMAYYGLSVKSSYRGKPAWVQVAFMASDIVFDSLLEDFVEDIGWIWFPFVLVLLLVNLLVARVGLAPLRTAAIEASSIGQSTKSIRLTEDGLPKDVHILVRAINKGLDRLEYALTAQRSFIADAAHELRTPVSVLKAHAVILPNFDGRDALVEEINAMARLVNQLLDSAKLEVLDAKPSEIVDLNEVAREVAAQLGSMAIDTGCSIEVIDSSQPALIKAANHYMCQALRNIVENAIKHTAEKTTVSIKVSLPGSVSVTDHGPGVPLENKEVIFKRFWQSGDPDRRGAGLGLDIAARIAAAYGGTISVDDAPNGGAIFTMKFPT